MPEIKNHAPGTFCWVELVTSDPAGAKKFYGELFGWNTTDHEMGITYTIANIGEGKYVAGMMELPKQAKSMGVPPNWMSYVHVTDVKASVEKAKSLGGKLVHGPMQMGPGTLAVLQDPAGGTFTIWNEPNPENAFVYGEPRALCWNELISTNIDIAGKFYADLFGWKLEQAQMPGMVYTLAKVGDTQVGGMMAQPKEMAGIPSVWMIYFAVTDCDGTASKTRALGGNIMFPPTDIPGIGRFSTLADPQGAVFAVLQPLGA